VSTFDLGAAYLAAYRRILEVLADVDEDLAHRAVPATPGWSVHDVVAHVRGVAADVRSGHTAGAPGPAWTESQVERGRAASIEELCQAWADDAESLSQALTAGAGVTMAAALVMDLCAHEQDLRGALGVPGHRHGAFYDWAVPRLVAGLQARAVVSDLTAVGVVTPTRRIDPAATVVLHTTDWELFRAAFGRRSAAQIDALEWSGAGQPAQYRDCLVLFGPAGSDLVEV
jgi:uncharacterized protein (TIGR03083 family)